MNPALAYSSRASCQLVPNPERCECRVGKVKVIRIGVTSHKDAICQQSPVGCEWTVNATADFLTNFDNIYESILTKEYISCDNIVLYIIYYL